VPRLIAQREPGHVRRDRIRPVAVQEAQQVHERVLAEDGKKEAGAREVRLGQQRLQ
jgi:hypothetical protein